MSGYKDYLNDKKEYSLSKYMYSDSEAFYHDSVTDPSDTLCDLPFTELVKKFQESEPFHAGIATWQKIIAFAFAKKLDVDETNELLQEYHFSSLYAKSLLESSIIFALSTGMEASSWILLYKKYKRLLKGSYHENKSAVFGKRLEKREFYSYLVSNKSLADSNTIKAIASELLVGYDGSYKCELEESFIKVLEEYYKENNSESKLTNSSSTGEKADDCNKGKMSISKLIKVIHDSIGLKPEKISYIIAKNASFENQTDIRNLYEKLKKNSSSLLTFDIVKSSVEGVEPQTAYEQLKVYFEDSFSLDELYEMLLLFSKEDPSANDSFGVTLDSTNQEISQWLLEAIEKENYGLFFLNAAPSFESIRYKKRRALFKYLYYLIQEKIFRFVEFEKEYINNEISKNNQYDVTGFYLNLARNTLIKSLPQICVSDYKLNSLSEDHYLDVDVLSKMDITFSSLFFDFSSFWGNYNLIGKAFINKFDVFVYRSDKKIKDVEKDHTLVKISRGNNSIELAFNSNTFCEEYKLDESDEETVKSEFLNKLSENIKGWDSISANSIEWLIDRSNISSWELNVDELLYEVTLDSLDDNPSKNTTPKKKYQADNRYRHDYRIFKNIITGKSDASRDFLLMFAVYCGAEIDEIEEHLLVNVGYFMLDDERPFDCLITALSIEPDLEIRRKNFFKIIEELDLAYESNEIELYLLQNEILNAISSETHEILLH
jgi:hypothetical protein